MKRLEITTCPPGFFGSTTTPYVSDDQFEPIEGDIKNIPGAYRYPDKDIDPTDTEIERYALKVYIHGDAEGEAGYDIPILVSGNIEQLARPIDEQDIVLRLANKAMKVKAVCMTKGESWIRPGCYYIVCKSDLKEVLEQVDNKNTILW